MEVQVLNTSILSSASTTSTPTATSFTTVLPPNSTDPDYVSGIGVGGNTSGNGLVVFNFTTTTFTKSVNKTTAAIGDTLTYTVVLNGGAMINNNTVFIDTIPTNTSFVTDSVFVNNVQQVGANPNPPGVNLGTIGPNSTTITFSVKVTNVPPTPFTIPNAASINADNLPSLSTNTVNTTVLAASLNTSKTVSKVNTTIGDILTYTIPITNIGNATALNILFIDTIPDGTSLVAGSFKQGTTAIGTSPNPPGTTLPASIGIGRTSIISFQVIVNTIPSPNPITNVATSAYSYFVSGTTIVNSTNTNSVNTNINYATLGGITKSADKTFANCGDVITYTIVIPNSGNVTAQNIIFKDTIPNGTVLVNNSVFINEVLQTGANLNSGVTIPNIAPGTTSTLTFRVQVQC